MKHLLFFVTLGLVALSCNKTDKKPLPLMKVNYPETKTIDHTDNYFDSIVPDPYRWLEDDRSTETGEWVKSQNDVSFDYLNKIPFRGAIRERLAKLWDYEKYSAPFKEGDYTYFYKNDGLQNQYVLYRQKGENTPEVFLNPNDFSTDGTTSLAGIDFSLDGTRAAYQISEGGSDWRKVIVLDAMSKNMMEDTLLDVKFSGLAWKGSEGFYYSSYDKPKEGSALSGKTQYHKLFYHKLGTAQSADQLVFGGEKTPRRYIGAFVTEDQQYLIITAAVSTSGNELYIISLKDSNAPIVNVIDNFEKEHQVVHSDGDWIFIYTTLNAPNGRLVKVKASNPAPENWTDVIAERKEPLSISTGGGYFFASYLKDAISLIEQVDLNGKVVRTISLPGKGTASGFSGKWKDPVLYFTFTSYTQPATIYSLDVKTGKSSIYKESKVDFNPADFESKQVFYQSKDGTKVPLIITYKKGLVLNGKNPTLLYGYGGFNISLTPGFSTSNIVWMENGGVYAVANLRGGGEYGEDWHVQGTKLKKQNVFDDFIAAAEYLIKEKYTAKEYLAISGGSNGGLLVGAAMTQRPELFKVALPAVGVLDMLRYHQFTAGAGWAFDYGTAQDSPEMFNYLKGYSPYHNLREGVTYPATLVTTADHDDRVVPAHSFKFAARLQKAHKGDSPVLIRIETNAGHGAGKPTAKIIDEQADKWAFTFYNMNVPVKYLKK
ncbi:MAG: prolyl oligopeptidase family serine peptidase [Saprospiraceae bacterium]|nr:prolyl oligopeptidase family serine peptidase [Saprospiraceae bacterium]